MLAGTPAPEISSSRRSLGCAAEHRPCPRYPERIPAPEAVPRNSEPLHAELLAEVLYRRGDPRVYGLLPSSFSARMSTRDQPGSFRSSGAGGLAKRSGAMVR